MLCTLSACDSQLLVNVSELHCSSGSNMSAASVLLLRQAPQLYLMPAELWEFYITQLCVLGCIV